jgi:hypothetical protein
MHKLIGPPKPTYANRATWRYRCSAPAFNPINGNRCGQLLTDCQCDPVEGPTTGGFRTLVAGPVLTHLPCGHDWWIGHGWAPPLERVPWAKG